MTAATNEVELEELEEVTELLAVLCVAWLSIVGVLWLYWANGGTTGVWTLWSGRTELSGARESWVEPLLWTIGLLALVLAAVALTIARRWTRFVPRGVGIASAFLLGLTLVPSVAVETVLRGVVLFGVVDSGVEEPVKRAWRLLFWNPWLVLGVLSFCATMWLDRHAHYRSMGKTIEPD